MNRKPYHDTMQILNYESVKAMFTEIGECIGGGGESIVYRVIHHNVPRALIINVNHRVDVGRLKETNYDQYTTIVERLKSNTRRNPHLVTIIDYFFFEADQRRYDVDPELGELLAANPGEPRQIYFGVIEELGTDDLLNINCSSRTDGVCDKFLKKLCSEMCKLSLYVDGLQVDDERDRNIVRVGVGDAGNLGECDVWCYEMNLYSIYIPRTNDIVKRIDLVTNTRVSEKPSLDDVKALERIVVEHLATFKNQTVDELLNEFDGSQIAPDSRVCVINVSKIYG
jgi:hypothetical protein